MLRAVSWATSAAALLLAISSNSAPHVSAATIDPNDKGLPLFPEGHPNITYLTDDNWDTIMSTHNDRPWLVDFYHPFCPHCKHFAPTYFEVGAYYKTEGSIYVGAISCMDHVKCRRVGIKGFPTLISMGFDKKRPGKEVARVVGTHTLQEVKDYVSKLFLEAQFNETGSTPPPTLAGGAPAPVGVVTVAAGAAESSTAATNTDATTAPEVKPGEQVRKALWEESTKPMNQTTRLQDAASAFIFGLKQGIFMGRELLEDVELDALKSWLALVSKTFPGSINRKLITQLSDQVAPIALLDFDTWDKMLNDWQRTTVFHFMVDEAKLDLESAEVAVPEWQRLSNLFTGQGIAYRACALYTCGQWNMFHMLTMNPALPAARDSELLVSVIATMRRFMKHFFGCVQCRDHFLEYNNLEMVKKIRAAANKPLALKRWLWEMHNAVNTRIRHPLWPKPEICPTCGSEGEWVHVEVDKWLGNTYEYREVEVPVRTSAPPPQTEKPEALRKEADEALPEAPQAKPEDATKPTQGQDPDVWKPKDAALGIDNPAQKAHHTTATKDQVKELADRPEMIDTHVNVKAGAADTLQGAQAPHVSLFAWYILPVAAVGAYLLFVRSRKRASFRNHTARE